MRILLSGVLLILIALAVFWVKNPDSPTLTAGKVPQTVTHIGDNEFTSSYTSPLSAEFQTSAKGGGGMSLPNYPPVQFKSLRGAVVPDGLRSDENDKLVRDANLRLLFDFFLMAQQDVKSGEFEQIVENWIRGHANEKVAAEALDLWNRYREYQKNLADSANASPPDISSASLTPEFLDRFDAALEQRGQLQKKWLADVEESWFAEDNNYDAATLSRLRQHLESGEGPATEQTTDAPWQHANTPEYERQLSELRQKFNVSAQEQKAMEEQLRRQYFPDRQSYIRQSLRDLSRQPDAK